MALPPCSPLAVAHKAPHNGRSMCVMCGRGVCGIGGASQCRDGCQHHHAHVMPRHVEGDLPVEHAKVFVLRAVPGRCLAV